MDILGHGTSLVYKKKTPWILESGYLNLKRLYILTNRVEYTVHNIMLKLRTGHAKDTNEVCMYMYQSARRMNHPVLTYPLKIG